MGKRYGMVIDLKRCIGCHTCTIACKAEHGIEKGSWINVSTIGGGSMDTPTGIYPDLKMHYLPKGCMHCAEAPCIDSCPSEALYRRSDGIVLAEQEKCNGCESCVEACPYGVIRFNDELKAIEKCDFCFERLDDGEEPFCVRCCEVSAMFFGDLNDPESRVSKLIKEKDGYCLMPEWGTKPSIYYLGYNPETSTQVTKG